MQKTSEESFVKRGKLALEDKEWERAAEFFDQALNKNPTSSEAYLGCALSDMQCVNLEDFVQSVLDGTQECEKQTIYMSGTTEDFKNEMVRKYRIPKYLDIAEIESLCEYKFQYESELQARQMHYENWKAYWIEDKWMSKAIRFANPMQAKIISQARQRLNDTLEERMRKAQEDDQKSKICVRDNYRKFIKNTKQMLEDKHQKALEKVEADYQTASEKIKTKDYQNAILMFEKLGDYKYSEKRKLLCQKRYAAAKKKRRIVSVAAVAIVVVVYILGVKIYKQNQFNQGIQQMTNGEYSVAYDFFKSAGKKGNGLGDLAEEMTNIINDVKQGYNHVSFGSYPMWSDQPRSKIEWKIVERTGDRILLVSQYILDVQPYNESGGDTTWENCTLRKWLNNDFLEKAFTEEERSMLLEVTYENPDNEEFGVSGGNDTIDKCTIVGTEDESVEYDVKATSYAVGKGLKILSDYRKSTEEFGNISYMWQRIPGETASEAMILMKDYDNGYYIGGNKSCAVEDSNTGGVRPMIWLSLKYGSAKEEALQKRYDSAIQLIESINKSTSSEVGNRIMVIRLLRSLGNYKDAPQLLEENLKAQLD